MEHITSKNNRWIRLAIRLKQKKYRDKNKMFLMEGVNHKRVQRLMHESGLAGKRPKEKYHSYTVSMPPT